MKNKQYSQSAGCIYKCEFHQILPSYHVGQPTNYFAKPGFAIRELSERVIKFAN